MIIKQLRNAAKPLRTLFAALVLSSGLLFSLSGTGLFAADALDSLKAITSFDAAALQEVAVPASFPGPLKSAPALNVQFINVWQGDAQYIELPNGKTVLIDAGPGDPEGVYAPPIIKWLTQNNITHLDYVVLTHPHADHFWGLQYVFSNIKVDNFYDTRMDNPGAPEIKALREKIAKDPAIKVTYPKAGDTLPWDSDVKVKVLHSCSEPGQSTVGNVLNDCSIVLKVTYQNTSILFTGDIQEDVEASLVKKYGTGLRAQVLKVSHHGSAHSSTMEFLKKVKPEAAYIEVGKYNPFGHPTQAALSRLTEIGAKIYRTDLSGTQTYTISGQ